MRGILTSSWCEAREEVGPDATQKRQFVGQNRPKPAKKTRIPGSIVLEYKLHVQISTFGALWAKLPYLFPRNTLADGFFQKWKSLYYGGILGVLKKSGQNVHGWKGLYYGGILVAQN